MKLLQSVIITIQGLLIALSLQVSLEAQETLDYVGRYRGQPVPALIRTERSQDSVNLLRIEGSDIVYRPQGQTQGEAFREISTIRSLMFVEPSYFQSAVRNADDKLYKQAAERMRPFVYALLPYQDIPSPNLFDILNVYLGTLVNAKETAEAMYLLRNVNIEKATPAFLGRVLELSRLLLDEGKQVEASVILNRIPFDKDSTELLQTISDYADDLRRNERYTEANFLYNRLIDVGDTQFRLPSILWHIYGDASAGRTSMADVFIRRYLPEAPSTEDPFFSLYQLIQARLHLLNDRQMEAVREVTRGVVFTMLDSEWTAELFYLNGQSYERLGNLPAAAEIYNTVIVFYPKTKWAIRAKASLDSIMPEVEKIKQEQQKKQEQSEGKKSEQKEETATSESATPAAGANPETTTNSEASPVPEPATTPTAEES
jgi:tetratricopeptide (TPR) repeat protein